MLSSWFRSTFLRVFKFLQIKEGGSRFWREPNLHRVSIIWSPILHFNFKSFMVPYLSSFIWFQCIVYDPGLLFSEFSNFYKLKSSDVISGENQFWGMPELFDPPFCIAISKVLSIEVLRLALDFNPFYMIQEYFYQKLQISRN